MLIATCIHRIEGFFFRAVRRAFAALLIVHGVTLLVLVDGTIESTGSEFVGLLLLSTKSLMIIGSILLAVGFMIDRKAGPHMLRFDVLGLLCISSMACWLLFYHRIEREIYQRATEFVRKHVPQLIDSGEVCYRPRYLDSGVLIGDLFTPIGKGYIWIADGKGAKAFQVTEIRLNDKLVYVARRGD